MGACGYVHVRGVVLVTFSWSRVGHCASVWGSSFNQAPDSLIEKKHQPHLWDSSSVKYWQPMPLEATADNVQLSVFAAKALNSTESVRPFLRTLIRLTDYLVENGLYLLRPMRIRTESHSHIPWFSIKLRVH